MNRCLFSITFASIALGAPVSARADGSGWIHEPTTDVPRLSVEQAIWAMGGLPRDGSEWTHAEKVAKIAEAGFEGFMVFLPGSVAEQEMWRDLASKYGLAITLQCAPANVAELEIALRAVELMKARGLVAMIRPTFVTYTEGERKIVDMMAAAKRANVPFYVETHRGTITQDLPLAAAWAANIPGIRIHADLSHFAISYEIGGDVEGTRIGGWFDAILARTGMIDGRIGNGEQVQIDIGPDGSGPHAQRFARWWKRAMVHWLATAAPGDVFVFKSELGPPNYSILGLDGREISDRWAQALVMRDLGIRVWNEAVRETGKGQAYTGPRVTKAAAGAGATGLTKETALASEVSKVPSLRGTSARIGEFHLCGQPLQPDFDIAKELGVKSVINLRLADELGGIGFDEAEYLREIGLEYRHFEVGPDSIDDELAEKILQAIAELPKPMVIHDSNANRVWGVWALHVGMEFGIPVDETQKAAKQNEVPRLVIDKFVRDYLKRKKGI
jgi:protein tyrosine phosphatase (PTP) superfamily phosphohydrolase (DUF442 family)